MFAAEGEELVSIPDEFDRRADIVHPLVAAAFTVVTLALTILIVITHIITIRSRNFPSIKANTLLIQNTYLASYIAIVNSLLQIIYNAIALSQRVNGIICHTLWGWLFSLNFALIMGPTCICARTDRSHLPTLCPCMEPWSTHL